MRLRLPSGALPPTDLRFDRFKETGSFAAARLPVFFWPGSSYSSRGSPTSSMSARALVVVAMPGRIL